MAARSGWIWCVCGCGNITYDMVTGLSWICKAKRRNAPAVKARAYLKQLEKQRQYVAEEKKYKEGLLQFLTAKKAELEEELTSTSEAAADLDAALEAVMAVPTPRRVPNPQAAQVFQPANSSGPNLPNLSPINQPILSPGGVRRANRAQDRSTAARGSTVAAARGRGRGRGRQPQPNPSIAPAPAPAPVLDPVPIPQADPDSPVSSLGNLFQEVDVDENEDVNIDMDDDPAPAPAPRGVGYECTCCMDAETAPAWVRLSCNHEFHTVCISRWNREGENGQLCPNCRAPMGTFTNFTKHPNPSPN